MDQPNIFNDPYLRWFSQISLHCYGLFYSKKFKKIAKNNKILQQVFRLYMLIMFIEKMMTKEMTTHRSANQKKIKKHNAYFLLTFSTIPIER